MTRFSDCWERKGLVRLSCGRLSSLTFGKYKGRMGSSSLTIASLRNPIRMRMTLSVGITTGQDRNVKGINFMTSLYHAQGYNLPVGFRIVEKTQYYTDKKSGKSKRRSAVSKNEHYRELLKAIQGNQIPFQYVLNDVWYASADNMLFIKHDLKKDFVMPLKANRKVALSEQAKRDGAWVRIDTLPLEPNIPMEIYLESVDFPLLLVKQIFTNGDGSTGGLYLVSSDMNLTYTPMTTIYHKRWNVEPYHKS